jgi:hypothetical protein
MRDAAYERSHTSYFRDDFCRPSFPMAKLGSGAARLVQAFFTMSETNRRMRYLDFRAPRHGKSVRELQTSFQVNHG